MAQKTQRMIEKTVLHLPPGINGKELMKLKEQSNRDRRKVRKALAKITGEKKAKPPPLAGDDCKERKIPLAEPAKQATAVHPSILGPGGKESGAVPAKLPKPVPVAKVIPVPKAKTIITLDDRERYRLFIESHKALYENGNHPPIHDFVRWFK